MPQWTPLKKMAPPEKWLEMYEHYQALLKEKELSKYWRDMYHHAAQQLDDLRQHRNNPPPPTLSLPSILLGFVIAMIIFAMVYVAVTA
jgi:hypothetical protein